MREWKKASKKIVSFVLAMCMIIGLVPMNSLAAPGHKGKKTAQVQEQAQVEALAETNSLDAALEKAKTYIDALTINNSQNDPANVVSNYGTHFTWDNEKRESSKSYLYDWSYYNGVVFEGLEYVYEVTKEEVYANYVKEYMSSLIASNGKWAKCTNNSSKECAGYNSTHGADCYKTASLLLDLYERTKDSRYLTMAKTLYADLDSAANKYLLSNAGKNYRHTWASDSTPDLWLDGLYMILPFRAEYAKYSNDTEELKLIVDRMQWVSDNMYNSSTKLFYHAADSASSNSGTYWLRSIGWYAAAIVDVMDSMEGENLEAMKAQLVKLVDGMKAYQNASNGMWLNNLAASQSSSNPYETSGTALVCYAVMKAVNEGWLDKSYADMAILAFEGICNEKLSGTTLKDICFKGAPGSSNSTFYDNEGKGVGPFIMFYAEVLEYANTEEEPVEPETPVEPEVTVEDTTIKVENVTNLSGTVVTEEDKAVIEEKEYTNFVAFDITATIVEGAKAMVSIPVPAEWNATEDQLVGISVEDGVVKEIKGTLSKDGIYSFEVDHFSAKGVAYSATPAAEEPGTGNLVGSKVYTLDTDGVTANKNYLIVNTNTESGYALKNNNGNVDSTQVTISGSGNNKTITVEDDKNIAWQFSGKESGSVGNSGRYVYPDNSSLSLKNNVTNMTISSQENGAYRIYRTEGNGWWPTEYYLSYNEGWTGYMRSWNNSERPTVYLYELTPSGSGEAVTFTVTPSSATLKVDDTATLVGTVTVAGKEVDLSKCTITWASSNTSAVTVTNGTATAVADGSATVTATLSAVDGTALQKNIELKIPVTVKSKTVVSGVLTGNNPVTTKQNVEPDFSDIKLTVTYDDKTRGTITVKNGLEITEYDISTIGYSYAKISYDGKEYGTVRVTVEGNPYEGKEEATEYPVYPSDGAVRIDKTATEIDFENTGVVQVELDVAGVSVKPAVDVILVTDLSNSMAWAAGGRTDATSHEETKVYDLQKSVAEFADIFLANDEDGTETRNTMSLVTFGGYDADYTKKVYTAYADPTQTLVLGSKDAAEVKNKVNNIRVLADDALNIGTSTTGYYLSFDGGNTYGENYGNTNYDHAFMQTKAAITQLKAKYKEQHNTDYDASGRQIYVLFMTDGAPSNYDGVYYNYKTGDRADVNSTWVNADGEIVTYTMGNNRAQYQKDPWFQYIAGGTYNASTGTIPGNPLYWADQVYNTQGVANIYNIGFDLDNGGFSSMTFTEADGRPLSKVLEKLVTGQTLEVFSADDEEGLSTIYKDLATKIRYAGTQANVTDIVDSDFTLQFTQTTGTESATVHGDLGFKPVIEIKSYELWTKEETTDTKLIGTRKTNADGTYIYTTLETVSFKDDGTEAYSDKVENGTKNIMSTASDGTVTIEALLFTYTKTPEGVETFKWSLGNITDKEVALSFYTYLKGSLEGKRENGLYYTNEEATLEYVDINDKHATQIFPIPAVAWGGASTAYEFYLVNDNGEPCDRNGNVLPFAHRIIITGPYYEELYLNQIDEEYAKKITAAHVLPAGYTLYDETAEYIVRTASGDHEGSLTISQPSADKKQTTILVSAVTPSYIQSRVAFGVIYNMIPEEADFELTPNEIVIDYGKQIEVKTAVGDENNVEDGFTATLVGFSKYYDSVDLKHKFKNTSAVDNFRATYGTFNIVDAGKRTVRYTPTAIVNGLEKVFCVVKMHNDITNDTYYMVDCLTVIPATSVYYETNFAENVFSFTISDTAWSDDGEKSIDDIIPDDVQDDGTIGKNPLQTYGYDDSYENDAYFSNGTSYYVEGQGYDSNKAPKTYTEFSFVGTGFEIISRTGKDQGLIKVEVTNSKGESEKTISVLNKSESELELYQIPVVSINDLEYGMHKVRISVDALYTSTIPALASLNRGNQFYFDAIRVFEPALGNAEAEAAYAMDGEANRQLTEVRGLLINKQMFEAIETNTNGMVFIDRNKEDIPDVATYATIGPNNETYLSKGQAVAFEIHANTIPASVDIGAKSITGAPATLKATITNNDGTSMVTTKQIASSTAQNINLLTDAEETKTIFASENVYVVVTNTGDGVLSITDIKVAFSQAVASVENEISPASNDTGIALASETDVPDLYAVSYSVDATTFALARRVLESSDDSENLPEVDEPEVEEPEVIPNYDIINASIAKVGGKKNEKTVITVETTQDVTKLIITRNKKEVKTSSVVYEDQENGTRIWTVTVAKTDSGNKAYTITGCGEDGTTGNSVSVTPPKKATADHKKK